jgi:hypothetical protein
MYSSILPKTLSQSSPDDTFLPLLIKISTPVNTLHLKGAVHKQYASPQFNGMFYGMTNKRDKLAIDFPFFDALSGEFVPKTDPNGQTQTLGRLSLATIRYGISTIEDCDGDPFPVFTSLPLWAGGVTCRVEGIYTGHSQPDMFGVQLKNERGKELWIHTPAPSDLMIGMDNEDLAYSLRAGRPLEISRAAVTLAAEEFFMNVARREL